MKLKVGQHTQKAIVNRLLGPIDNRRSDQKIKNASDFIELKTRFRSIEVYVHNKTNQQIQFTGSYFFSGQWYYHIKQTKIAPGQTWFECAANKDGKAFTGVTGGCSFMIESIKIGFGFTNPWMGSYKISIIKGNAEQAYDACKDSNNKSLRFGQYVAQAHLDDAMHGAQKAFVFTFSED